MTTDTTHQAPGLFDALAYDELRSLSDTIVTNRPHQGYGSNRMCMALAGTTDDRLYRTYSTIASEIGRLHHEVCERILAYPHEAWEAEHPISPGPLVVEYIDDLDTAADDQAWAEADAEQNRWQAEQVTTGTGWPA